MKKALARLFTVILVIAVGAYAIQWVRYLGSEVPAMSNESGQRTPSVIAIFGATGTVGDGLLKAAMNDAEIEKIHVVTRRTTPRIDAGVESGKIEVTLHTDYLDYKAIEDKLQDVQSVYWAIGLSAVGLDDETYREIHIEFPVAALRAWMSVAESGSFHYVSGAGTKADSRMMWAREKARAEISLAELAADSGFRVVSYRPSIVTPTEVEAGFGNKLAHTIFAPINMAVLAEGIGKSMIEVDRRTAGYQNSSILENGEIVGLAEAYDERLASD